MELNDQIAFDPPGEQHDELWNSDGNVVLSAVDEEKTRTILFRIHKSSLAKRSEVFESMFGLPSAEEGGAVEKYGGLPLVRMPDSAEEVEALLNAIYDPYSLFQRSVHSDTPLRLRKPLHMASKYLMGDLRQKLVEIVEKEWPPRLKDMEQRDRILEDAVDGCETFAESEWPAHFIPEPAAAVALAEDYNIPSILPMAYYNLLRCDPGESWDMVFNKNSENNGCLYLLSSGSKPARWECLSAESLLKLLRLQKYVQTAHLQKIRFRFREMKSLCEWSGEGRSPCRAHWEELVQQASTAAPRVQDRDIFKNLRVLVSELERSSHSCSKCYDAYNGEIKASKSAIWKGFKELCLSGLGDASAQ